MLFNSFSLLVFVLMLTSIQSSANENWIPIQTMQEKETPKRVSTLDINLSQVKSMDKIMKNATAIKQLIDTTSKKEKVVPSDKNWFVLEEEN